jgi:hypothetical protein
MDTADFVILFCMGNFCIPVWDNMADTMNLAMQPQKEVTK